MPIMVPNSRKAVSYHTSEWCCEKRVLQRKVRMKEGTEFIL